MASNERLPSRNCTTPFWKRSANANPALRTEDLLTNETKVT
jgi:hypothetical protein